MICIAVLVGFWCRHAASAVSELKATGILPVWSDYFIHGSIIAEFGDPLAVSRGSIELVGEPLAFYHYAAYMIPAALASVADLPGLALATSVMLPLGLLVAGLGSYALGTALADRRAGVVAIAFLLLLPDPSLYGLNNGFLGFHWLLFTAPGSGYGLGAAAIALVFANEWFSSGSRAALMLALALTAAMFQLRAHIFLLFAPALVLTLICGTELARRHTQGMCLPRSAQASSAWCCCSAYRLCTVFGSRGLNWISFFASCICKNRVIPGSTIGWLPALAKTALSCPGLRSSFPPSSACSSLLTRLRLLRGLAVQAGSPWICFPCSCSSPSSPACFWRLSGPLET